MTEGKNIYQQLVHFRCEGEKLGFIPVEIRMIPQQEEALRAYCQEIDDANEQLAHFKPEESFVARIFGERMICGIKF